MLGDVEAFLASRGLAVETNVLEGGARLQVRLAEGESPWEIVVVVGEDDRRLAIYSLLPLEVPPDRRVDVALLLTRINDGLIIGNFELDLRDGQIAYKTSVDVGDLGADREILSGLLDANLVAVETYLDAINGVILGVGGWEATADALDAD